MHAKELNAVAVSLALHAETQLALARPIAKQSAETYWLNCRYRHEYWSGKLASHRAAIQRPGVSHRNTCWREISPVIQEILISEPLTRCVAHHSKLLEDHEIDVELVGLAASALAAHTEARHRCLHLIVFGTGLSPEMAVGLNRLRRAMEQFNDQLIGILRPTTDSQAYCFDQALTSQMQQQSVVLPAQIRSWYLTSLQAWLFRELDSIRDETSEPVSRAPANARLNAQLSQAVLSMFSQQEFDGFGLSLGHRSSVLLNQDSLEGTGCLPDQYKAASPLDVLHTTHDRSVLADSKSRRW